MSEIYRRQDLGALIGQTVDAATAIPLFVEYRNHVTIENCTLTKDGLIPEFLLPLVTPQNTYHSPTGRYRKSFGQATKKWHAPQEDHNGYSSTFHNAGDTIGSDKLVSTFNPKVYYQYNNGYIQLRDSSTDKLIATLEWYNWEQIGGSIGVIIEEFSPYEILVSCQYIHAHYGQNISSALVNVFTGTVRYNINSQSGWAAGGRSIIAYKGKILFSAESTTVSGRLNLIAINYNTLSMTTVFDQASTWTTCAYTQTYPKAIPNTATTNKYFTYMILQSVSAILDIHAVQFNIDISTEAATVKKCVISYGAYSQTDVKAFTIAHNISPRHYRYDVWISWLNGNRYLNIIFCENVDSVPTANTVLDTMFRLYTFSIDSADGSALTLISAQQMPYRTRSIMHVDSDGRRMLIISDNQIQYFKMNQTNAIYELYSSYACNAASVYIDEYERTWVGDTLGTLHLLSAFVPATVDVGYEHSVYDFTGTSINTYCTLDSYDQYNARIASNILLTIDSNNATFTGGAKQITVMTSNTGTVQVPFIISGAGFVRILANITV